MQVAFHLRQRSETAPASALLVPTRRAEDVLQLCVRIGSDAIPRIFAVADGFLIKLPHPTREVFGGVIRLRSLAENLLVPVGAELVPTLLEDEAAALVSRRGLVFLPGGRVLEFASDRPLSLAEFLEAPRVERASWQAFPDPPELAERLLEIVHDLPGPSPEEIIQAGGEGIGTETPRPPGAGLPARVLGGAAYGLGRGLAGLGSVLHLGWLARLGARAMAAGMALAPRLSEALLGKQEAALRELLRKFREGKIDNALRHALPLGGDTQRGAGPSTLDRLPGQGFFYSLRDLLGGSGLASWWYGSDEVFRELEKEYRNQAELAVRRGDYRRAAFIFGKLLNDFRAAAAVLARGGLHRDAAVLYQVKLGDTVAAAREYEAAGDIDRALQLYRQASEYELAGDLLRRAGEEELAIAEYQLAAQRLIAIGQGHYQAGEMMLARAKRADLALPYYQSGWGQRPGGSPIPCAVRLAQHHTQAGELDRLVALAAEGEDFLRPLGNDGPAGEFFNELARLAERPHLARIRDDLRDRALLGIASKLRQRAEFPAKASHLIPALMGPDSVWSSAVASDALFAVRSLDKVQPLPAGAPAPLATIKIPARIPVVTAVCWAPIADEIFLGFESGEVACYRPSNGEVEFLPLDKIPVCSLAVDGEGKLLIAVRRVSPNFWHLSSVVRKEGRFRYIQSRPVQAETKPWLVPPAVWDGSYVSGFGISDEIQLLSSSLLIPLDRLHFFAPPQLGFLLPSFGKASPSRDILVFESTTVTSFSYWVGIPPGDTNLGWRPSVPGSSTLKRSPLAWVPDPGDTLEIAGFHADGNLYWSKLEFKEGNLVEATTTPLPGQGYLAAAIVRPGLLAAVTRTNVQWFRRGLDGIRCVEKKAVSFPEAVACFPHYRGNDLIVVSADGGVAKVPGLG